jgi:hypothetical protein
MTANETMAGVRLLRCFKIPRLSTVVGWLVTAAAIVAVAAEVWAWLKYAT